MTGFGYEHDDPWAANMNLFKEFTDISRVTTIVMIGICIASMLWSIGIRLEFLLSILEVAKRVGQVGWVMGQYL